MPKAPGFSGGFFTWWLIRKLLKRQPQQVRNTPGKIIQSDCRSEKTGQPHAMSGLTPS
jgi:hypothetical protein